eukprot:58918-Pyramimonas_sp.AAC.2
MVGEAVQRESRWFSPGHVAGVHFFPRPVVPAIMPLRSLILAGEIHLVEPCGQAGIAGERVGHLGQ